MPISNFQPIRLLYPDCWYKLALLMANSADPDQLASEANWSGSTLFARHRCGGGGGGGGRGGFNRNRVNQLHISSQFRLKWIQSSCLRMAFSLIGRWVMKFWTVLETVVSWEILRVYATYSMYLFCCIYRHFAFLSFSLVQFKILAFYCKHLLIYSCLFEVHWRTC